MDILTQSYNNATQSDFTAINNKIAELKRLLTEAHKNYNYCRSQGAFFSCIRNTGKKQGVWYEDIKKYERELVLAKSEQSDMQQQLRTVTELQKTEHEQEILEQREWSERGKKLGIFAGIGIGIIGAGALIYFLIKKTRK